MLYWCWCYSERVLYLKLVLLREGVLYLLYWCFTGALLELYWHKSTNADAKTVVMSLPGRCRPLYAAPCGPLMLCVVFEPPRDTGWPPGLGFRVQLASLLALPVKKYKYRRKIPAGLGEEALQQASLLALLVQKYKY